MEGVKGGCEGDARRLQLVCCRLIQPSARSSILLGLGCDTLDAGNVVVAHLKRQEGPRVRSVVW